MYMYIYNIYIYIYTYICSYRFNLIYIYLACVIFKRTNVFIPAKHTPTHTHKRTHTTIQTRRHRHTRTRSPPHSKGPQSWLREQSRTVLLIHLASQSPRYCVCVLQCVAVYCSVLHSVTDWSGFISLLSSCMCIYADIYAHTYRICIYIYRWAPTREKDTKNQAKKSWILIRICIYLYIPKKYV